MRWVPVAGLVMDNCSLFGDSFQCFRLCKLFGLAEIGFQVHDMRAFVVCAGPTWQVNGD